MALRLYGFGMLGKEGERGRERQREREREFRAWGLYVLDFRGTFRSDFTWVQGSEFDGARVSGLTVLSYKGCDFGHCGAVAFSVFWLRGFLGFSCRVA